MSENVEEKVVIEPELLEEHDFSEAELVDENTDWKAKALELKGLNKRRAAKLKKANEFLSQTEKKQPTTPTIEKQNSGYEDALRLSQLSYLNSLGIPKEDHDYVIDEAKNVGKTIDSIMAFKYVQEDLKTRQEERKVKTSLPTASKRSGTASVDSADYYLAKVERGDITLGQIPDVKVRREVRKMREVKSGGHDGDMIFGRLKG